MSWPWICRAGLRVPVSHHGAARERDGLCGGPDVLPFLWATFEPADLSETVFLPHAPGARAKSYGAPAICTSRCTSRRWRRRTRERFQHLDLALLRRRASFRCCAVASVVAGSSSDSRPRVLSEIEAVGETISSCRKTRLHRRSPSRTRSVMATAPSRQVWSSD